VIDYDSRQDENVASILNIGVSALSAYQRTLNTTGHNIANAETEGYSRQRVNLGTQIPQLTGAGWIGSGVRVTDVQRLYDDFLATQMRSTQSTTSDLQAFYQQASWLDNMVADAEVGLDPAIQDFFSALQVLSDDPSSVSTRQVVLSEAQSLVDRFNSLANQMDGVRDLLNNHIDDVAVEITSLAESIAEVNQSIVEALGSAGGDPPNDLLDKREILLNELAEKVDISVVAQENGAWNVFIGRGQPLVLNTDAATITTALNANDVNARDIIYSGVGGSNTIITDVVSGGELGGILRFQDDMLNPAQNQLGLIAVGIADRMNSQHQLGLDLDGLFGVDLFTLPSVEVLANNATAPGVTVSIIDSGNLTASDYELVTDDGAAGDFTLTRLSDNQTWTFTAGAYPYTYPPAGDLDGLSISIPAAAATGDTFLIRPTRPAARDIALEIQDPRKLAAAGPVRAEPSTNTVSGGPNLGTATITSPEVTDLTNIPLVGDITLEFSAAIPGFTVTGGPGGTIAYDPTTQSAGVDFNFPAYGNMTFTIRGVPQDGDRFVIGNNTSGIGDNRNVLAMGDLQYANTLLGDSSGTAETATFQQVYGQLVADVGAETRHTEIITETSEALLERHQMALSSVSGVNLDEEAANLVRYQQAYQAAAQVISVANTIFDTLMGAVRR
jgi:flagellar hook-associated protein 1 FlgK